MTWFAVSSLLLGLYGSEIRQTSRSRRCGRSLMPNQFLQSTGKIGAYVRVANPR